MSDGRIERCFATLRAEERAAFVTFVMAGDPDAATATELVCGLPAAGVDIVELGMPFSDPMADGPIIQRAGQRALRGGQTMADTLALAATLRERHAEVPIVLMGYYNPILTYGVQQFATAAAAAGVDGVIVVDVPPEEDGELRPAATDAGLRLIRLATPTTDADRLPTVLAGSSGFVYYVSITGITGAAAPDSDVVGAAVAKVRAASPLPVCVGFGVRTPEHAAEIARVADGVVVGSAIVDRIEQGDTPAQVLTYVRSLADGVRTARSATS